MKRLNGGARVLRGNVSFCKEFSGRVTLGKWKIAVQILAKVAGKEEKLFLLEKLLFFDSHSYSLSYCVRAA